MLKINSHQKTICKIIFATLKVPAFRKNWNREAYRKILDEAIRQYAQVTSDGETTWQDLNLYKKHHKFTERAVKILKKKTNKARWNDFHYEHIIPVSVTKKLLEAIHPKKITIKKVYETLKDCEVIILAPEEQNVLDGQKKKLYLLDRQEVNGAGLRSKGNKKERLESIGAKLHDYYIRNHL
jgi:hypothetical protein